MNRNIQFIAVLFILCFSKDSLSVEPERGTQSVNQTISVNHVTFSTKTPYETFVDKFESQLGHHNISAYQNLLNDPKKTTEVENILHGQEGSSGLMIFAVYDHGALLMIKSAPQKAHQYVIGNPLVAARMTEHNIGAALYAPLRVLVYADSAGNARAEYDLPTSLFGQFQNEKVTQVARELDHKLSDLIKKSQVF